MPVFAIVSQTRIEYAHIYSMIFIFTDIDGVLNPEWKKKWSKKAVLQYNRACRDFGLLPVITSTWRLAHSKEQLQHIFREQGVEPDIFDYTPHIDQADRGLEIKKFLEENTCDGYVVIDDRVHDIAPHVENVVKCRSWLGFGEEEYEEIKKILGK